MNHFYPVMIHTTHKDVNFKNEIKGNIPRNSVIHQKQYHDLCYHCSKDVPDFLFGKLRIGDCRYEQYFPEKRKLLSSQIKMHNFLRTMVKEKEGDNIRITIML